MIFWNFKTPLTFLACVVWNLSETLDIPLKKMGPVVFHTAIGAKKYKKKIKK